MPLRFAWLCSHESFQPEALVEQAVAAERAGFDMVTGADHFHPWVDDESAANFVWAWFGAVAQATERVALATSVTCPLFRYHPVVLRMRADEMDPGEILGHYTVVGDAEALADAYLPLVTDVGADAVATQVASMDPLRTIELVGSEVLPRLRAHAP